MNRMFTTICSLIVCTLLFSANLIAHDEPPKTRDEQRQKERIRSNFAQHRVRIQHAWVMLPERPSRPADSLLWQSNHFDQRGNLIEQVTFDSTTISRYLRTYGENNVWLEELIYAEDTLDERTVFVYQPNGLIHQILSFDTRGHLSGRLEYAYLDSTREITTVKYASADSVLYRIVYSYVAGEDFVENVASTQHRADGSLMVRVENSFNAGKRTSKNVYGPDGSLNRVFSYRYTDSGDFAEIITLNAEGTVLSNQTYIYSSDGQLLELITSSESGEVTRRVHYHYEYFKDPLNNG